MKILKKFENFEPITKPKPATKPGIKPSRPPKPKVLPQPKNFLVELEKVMSRYLKLGGFIKESLEDDISDLGLSDKAKRNIVKDYPKSDVRKSIRLIGEIKQISDELSELESKLFENSDLEKAVENIVRELFKNSKGFDADDVNYDLKIVRVGEGGSPDKNLELESDKEYPELDDAIKKRKLINYITQGFSFSSFDKLFDSDINTFLDFISSEVQKLYFEYFSKFKEAHDHIDIQYMDNYIDGLMELFKKMGKSGFSDMMDKSGGVQASVRIDYDESGIPIIIARGNNFITLFHETLKGVYEITSHHGLSNYSEEELVKIYSKTDNWKQEYRAFKYGHKVVFLFMQYFKEVEDSLIRSGEINDYDYGMMAGFLAYIYSNMKDSDFLHFMDEILQSNGDVERGVEIYLTIIGQGVDVDDDYVDDYKLKTTDSEPSIDDILDKINDSGYNSLTSQEKEILNKFSNSESIVKKFKRFLFLTEKFKR